MGISIWQLLIILAIVLVLFGAKRLSTLGSDLGSAVKGFRKSMSDDGGDGTQDDAKLKETRESGDRVFDAESNSKNEQGR